jgi:ParB/RepB/Spo0J family partition protein
MNETQTIEQPAPAADAVASGNETIVARLARGDPIGTKRWFAHVRVEEIARNPGNPRRHFPTEAMEELAASIRAQGVLQPLALQRVDVIDPDDAARPCRYQLILGERRWRAARMAHLEEVPAMVVEGVEPGQAAEMALVENLQREDLNAIEEAEGMAGLRALGLTQEAIAERVGRSRPRVANALRLLDLPEAVKEHIRAGRLTPGHGEALLRFKAWPKVVEAIAEFAIRDEVTSGDLEDQTVPYLWHLEADKLARRIGGHGAIGLPENAADGEPWAYVAKGRYQTERFAMDVPAYEAWLAEKKKTRQDELDKKRSEALAVAAKAKASGKAVPKKVQEALAMGGNGERRGFSEADKKARAKKIEQNRAAREKVEAAFAQAVETIGAITEVRAGDLALVAGWAEDSFQWHFREASVQREAASRVGVQLSKERPFEKLPAVEIVKVILAQGLLGQYEVAKKNAGEVPEDMEAYAEGYEKRLPKEPKAAKPEAQKKTKGTKGKGKAAEEEVSQETAEAAEEGAKKGSKARISPEMQQRIVDAIVAGGTGAAVAKKFGVSLPTVQTIKKAAGLCRKGEGAA